ncbi:hypothetical protein ACQP1P_36145 [Dactylosporangium sp. CA-052675]|uniref:hypothetical protein n=1 Tax=Dactylosporangium sp. CA-052675 TaxID=3239927 RepID=UPI003D8C7CE3
MSDRGASDISTSRSTRPMGEMAGGRGARADGDDGPVSAGSHPGNGVLGMEAVLGLHAGEMAGWRRRWAGGGQLHTWRPVLEAEAEAVVGLHASGPAPAPSGWIDR